MVFWHNDGWTISVNWKRLFVLKLKEYQYQEVKGPFSDGPCAVGKNRPLGRLQMRCSPPSSENREYCIKPMNCRVSVQIFDQGAETAPATCRCVWRNSVAATVTNRLARCIV